jgi:hypothetical protein
MESLAIKRAVLRSDHPSIATSCQTLANLLRERVGDFDSAEQLAREALRIRQSMAHDELGDRRVLASQTLLWRILINRGLPGDWVEAVALSEDRVKGYEAAYPPGDPKDWYSIWAKNDAGWCLAHTGSFAEAVAILESTIAELNANPRCPQDLRDQAGTRLKEVQALDSKERPAE